MSNTADLPVANQLDAIIEEFNAEFALVSVGSSIRILWEKRDPSNGLFGFELLSVNDFKTLTKNRPSPSPDRQSLAEFWLRHPQRRSYQKIDFAPGGAPAEVFNLWRGFPIEPKRGNSEKFWAFVRDVTCAGKEPTYNFVRKWLAHLVQRPQELPGTALVQRGLQGTGKNTFADTIGKLVGEHYLPLTNLDQVAGRFNGHLANKILLHANEAIWGGNKSSEGALKALITDPVMAVEYKGKDISRIGNYKRLIVSSNEQWAVPRGLDDRRFVVLDISAQHRKDEEYFRAIHEELKGGGLEALMHDLKSENLEGFNSRVIPVTGAGLDMKLKSASTPIAWLFEFLDDTYKSNCGYANTRIDIPAEGGSIEKNDLYDDYMAFCSHQRTRPDVASQFFKSIKTAIPSLKDSRGKAEGGLGRPRMAVLPPLSVARREFETYLQQPGEIAWCELDPTLALHLVKKAA